MVGSQVITTLVTTLPLSTKSICASTVLDENHFCAYKIEMLFSLLQKYIGRRLAEAFRVSEMILMSNVHVFLDKWIRSRSRCLTFLGLCELDNPRPSQMPSVSMFGFMMLICSSDYNCLTLFKVNSLSSCSRSSRQC